MPDLKFTPGPWFQSHREGNDGMYRTQVYDKNGETIASLAWYPFTVDNNTYTLRDQNAKLISAAPDLLEALKRFIAFTDNINNSSFESSMILQAKLAIKKATE